MHATHQCNAMIEAALKDVFLCSLYWAWITITVHLPLIPQCWENQWEWFKAIWTMVQRLCHHGMSALQELCFSFQIKRHLSATAFDVYAIEHIQPAQHNLWWFQFLKTCTSSPLWHSPKHEVIVLKLLTCTWTAVSNITASSLRASNCASAGFYLYTRSHVELLMWDQGYALLWKFSPCNP